MYKFWVWRQDTHTVRPPPRAHTLCQPHSQPSPAPAVGVKCILSVDVWMTGSTPWLLCVIMHALVLWVLHQCTCCSSLPAVCWLLCCTTLCVHMAPCCTAIAPLAFSPKCSLYHVLHIHCFSLFCRLRVLLCSSVFSQILSVLMGLCQLLYIGY